jgi:hypothetical protein
MMAKNPNQGNPHRPWQVVLLLLNARHHTIAQFQNRQEAEHHLRTIQRLARNSRFALLFVPPDHSADSKR